MKALVFGRFETGYGILRSLKDLDADLYSIDYKEDVAFNSKYGIKLTCPSPFEDKALLTWLKSEFKLSDKAKVFISSDDFLDFFNRNREELDHLDLEIPDAALLDSLQNKYFQYEVCVQNNINAPATFILNDDLDLSSLPYPVFLKGLEVNSWRNHYGGSLKGFVIRDSKELQEWMTEYPYQKVETIVQSLIIGPDENHFKYCAYRNRNGEIMAEFMLQKLIQFPIGFGIGAATKSVYDQELLSQGRRLFESINYLGVGSAEFKLDERDGKLKLIELNPRYWQQNYQATACGVNFPMTQYLGSREFDESKPSTYKVGLIWMNRLLVARALVYYLKKGWSNFMERYQLLNTGPKVYSHFNMEDRAPFRDEAQNGVVFLKLPFVLFKDFLKAKK